MTTKQNRLQKSFVAENFYTEFDRIDGQHPWMTAVPEGFVGYRVRELRQGKIAYFNFFLAKEMGLISADHPHQMNSDLEQKLLSTFSLQIINEYDELSKRRIDPETIKPHAYMATRYLQLQHADKQGRTSGDGRGIWNGVVSHRGTTWDVSSRGTGVTCLAPGAVQANRPLKTGDTAYGYGCGQAEIDELLSAAILAESMHLQGIATERVLCIIDLGRGVGIGVRAAPNLIRPAHLFLYLKQERLDELRRATDYFIDRQVKNRRWQIKSKDSRKYDEMCAAVCESFADFTAKLDMDYIFAWLDWDGDNVLADAGIIDYGSVRQFGIRHDRYRYDDVERFSTNLNEQRLKARLIVQVFVQMADYLKTGKKKNIRSFAQHPVMQKFDRIFAEQRAERLLYRVGFSTEQRASILKNHRGLFDEFDRLFSGFERAKISGAPQRVADGINHPALYNMRNILRALPAFYAGLGARFSEINMDENEFHSLMLSGFAKSRDARLGRKHRDQIRRFQDVYKSLVKAAGGKNPEGLLGGLSERAAKLNNEGRITGNALIEIVDEMLQQRRRGLSLDQVQKIIDRLVQEHVGFPEVNLSRPYRETRKAPVVRVDLYTKLLSIVKENRETI
ncbi:MAG: hypothetical protein KF865_01890 [Bdellovibrionaceae bacterium]|nr:hypothetical protein [Pseudobdellovibrionaceae bacterium]